jgi:hypothetical protein
MLGVADGALFGLVAVVARSGGDAGGDLGMAGEAFGGRDLSRGLVTGRAPGVAGFGGVGLAQRAGDLLGGAYPGGDRESGQGQQDGQAGERCDRVP